MDIFLFYNGEWFSTVHTAGSYGLTGRNIRNIQKAIQDEIDYWKKPITWKLFLDGLDITQDYLTEIAEV